MNIENNYKNNSINFRKTEAKMEPTKDEKLTVVLEKCKELLFEAAQLRMPENGKFSKFSIEFEIPQTNNQGVLTIDFDANDPKNMRLLTLGVHHKNSDRLISNILFLHCQLLHMHFLIVNIMMLISQIEQNLEFHMMEIS